MKFKIFEHTYLSFLYAYEISFLFFNHLKFSNYILIIFLTKITAVKTFNLHLSGKMRSSELLIKSIIYIIFYI